VAHFSVGTGRGVHEVYMTSSWGLATSALGNSGMDDCGIEVRFSFFLFTALIPALESTQNHIQLVPGGSFFRNKAVDERSSPLIST
jgi:hypothetical protein